MTLPELATILESTGMPVAYYAFPVDDQNNPPPDLPFIVYLVTGTNNFSADGIVYHCIQSVQIELYTELKSPENEALVENALTDAGIFWQRSEAYIESEHCWEIIYSIEV